MVNSQHYTSGLYTSSNDQGAEDFMVPEGKSWTVTEVDVTGQYQGRGPAATENVNFCEDKKGVPGYPVANGTFDNLKGADNGGSFAISLGNEVRLRAGTHGLRRGQCGFDRFRFLGWAETGTIKGYEAMWQNPVGGSDTCATWGKLENCVSGSPADFMFALQGTSR